MMTKYLGHEIVVLGDVLEIQFGKGREARRLSVILVLGVTQRTTRDKRTAEVWIRNWNEKPGAGIHRGGGEIGPDVELQGGRAAQRVFATCLVFLLVKSELIADPVAQKRLVECGVQSVKLRPFFLVRSVDQLVIKIEDRRIGNGGRAIDSGALIKECGADRIAAEVLNLRKRRAAKSGDGTNPCSVGADRVVQARLSLEIRKLTRAWIGEDRAKTLKTVAWARPEPGFRVYVVRLVRTDVLPIRIGRDQTGIVEIDYEGIVAGMRFHRGDCAQNHATRIDHLACRRKEPRRNLVDGRRGARPICVDLAVFKLHAERRASADLVHELWFPAQRDVFALIFVKRRILLVIFFIIQECAANRQLSADALVEIQRAAIASKTAKACADCRFVVAKGGVVGCAIDDAGAAAVAEENRVGAALHIDTRRVVAVPWDVRHEEVACVVRRVETADTRCALRGEPLLAVVKNTGVAQRAEIAARPADLRAGHELQQALTVGRANIAHEFLGRDGNGRTDVFEISANACSGQALGGLVSDVPIGPNFEWTENHRGFLPLGRFDCFYRNFLLGSGRIIFLGRGRLGDERSCREGKQDYGAG